MNNPICPFCGTALTFDDYLIDVATMALSLSIWYCPTCVRFLDDDDLVEIREKGIMQYLLKEQAFDDLVIYGDTGDHCL